MGEEFGAATARWKRQAMLSALGLCLIGVAAVLGGVALMFWAVVRPEHIQAPWALVVAPLVPLVVAIGCLVAASRTQVTDGPFDSLRQQMKADVAMLREVSTP
ncbi:MAG TPA: hypothetical protein VHQ87_06705 [Rhizobacter sp.]|nr:hypothetical protein [Rhizobacter sp.]